MSRIYIVLSVILFILSGIVFAFLYIDNTKTIVHGSFPEGDYYWLPRKTQVDTLFYSLDYSVNKRIIQLVNAYQSQARSERPGILRPESEYIQILRQLKDRIGEGMMKEYLIQQVQRDFRTNYPNWDFEPKAIQDLQQMDPNEWIELSENLEFQVIKDLERNRF